MTATPLQHGYRKSNSPQSRLRRAALAVAALALLIDSAPARTAGLNPADRQPATSLASPVSRLAQAKSWGYQLQAIDPTVIAASPFDLVVVDYSSNGTHAKAFSAAEVAQMRTKPDGSSRVVLAYLSIGEAESYRFYWQPRWSWMLRPSWSWFWQLFGDRMLPSWIGAPNAQWSGNYAVDYTHPAWQSIIAGGEESYLDRIQKAGFDGIYLDRIDAHEEMAGGGERARAAMIAFVRRIAGAARARQPGFLIVAQNGEELLHDEGYRQILDGFAKEDLLFGEGQARTRNEAQSINDNIGDMKLLLADGKPVFVVEYLRDPEQIERARQEIIGHGFVPYFADRELSHLRMGRLPRLQPGSR